jgi:hypothetical protein
MSTKSILKIVLCLLGACAAAWGQGSTAQITGSVKDATGGAVPGAEVKATQTATGANRTVTSGADGSFIMQDLPIGPWQVEVSKEGFSKYVQTGIILQVDSSSVVDAQLKVGAVSEQVSVQADAALVETHTTAIGSVVNNQQIAEMPLNGRNPMELVFLAGMATYPGNGDVNTVRNYPTVVVSVAGGQPNGTIFLLDGTIYQDPYGNLALPLPFPDALQEFKVETSAVPAEYGYHAGAAVNAVTKSGTNSYHGDLFEFVRNGDLDARDFASASRDTLHRNQYGGVIGGPVLPRFKDKLFFFFGFQETAQVSAPSDMPAQVPTAQVLGGDFTAWASAACNGGVAKPLNNSYDIAAGFVNNVLPQSLLNPVALNLAKTLPPATSPCGATTFGYANGSHEQLYVSRIDYQINQNQTFFGRFVAGNLNDPSTYTGGNPLSINTYAIHDLDYQLGLGHTWLFGSNKVNSVRLAASRTNVAKIPDQYSNIGGFGAQGFTGNGGNNVNLAVSGGGGFVIGGGAAVPGASHNGPNPSLADDFNWVHGNHQIGFGGSIYQQRMNYESGLNAVGSMTANGSYTGLGMADFLLGDLTTFSQGLTYGFYNRQYYSSLYVQDSWKVTPRLTLNYGVRWEPYTAPWSAYGQFSHFDNNLYEAGVHSTVFTNAPPGLVFPGDSQYSCGKSLNCPQWDKFFPRLGVVWDPFGDGKSTVRAAYGMYGDRNHMFYSNFISQYAPFGNTIAESGGTSNILSISNPWGTYPGGNPIPALLATGAIGHAASNAPFYPLSSFTTEPLQNYKAPYTNQWNLSIQRQVGKDWLFTANYLGSSQIHLTTSNLINYAQFLGLGPCTLPNSATGALVTTTYPVCSTTGNYAARRILTLENPATGGAFNSVSYTDDGGTGTYDGLSFTAQRRLSKGIAATATYTWSHCISDIEDQQTSSTAVAGVVPGDRKAYRSNCIGIDVRQNVILNLVATTPKFSNKWLRIVASDWQVAPILSYRSAQFFTIVSGTDRALTDAPVTAQTGNLVSPNSVYASNPSFAQILNPAAFQIPALGTYGNLGYNNIKGPDIIQLNLALSRAFAVREKMAFQIRADFFNLPNLINGAAGSGSNGAATSIGALNNPLFGQVVTDISGNNGLTNSGDPRIIQLAAKFVF